MARAGEVQFRRVAPREVCPATCLARAGDSKPVPIHSRTMVGLAFIAIGAPFFISLATTYTVRAWARRADFVDRPGGHKRHESPVALGGGMALMLSICGPILLGTLVACFMHSGGTPADRLPTLVQTHLAGIASKLPAVFAIVGGAVVLHVVGLIDDRSPLGPTPK